MSLWTRLKYWWLTHIGRAVSPPEEPKERLTLEEALEKFQSESEAEWEAE